MARATTRLVAILLAVLMTASCGHGGLPTPFDEDLAKKLATVQESGDTVLLRDLTGGDWDRVHIYSEGHLRDRIEQQVGSTVDMEESLYGDWFKLLVFVKDGKAQRAVRVRPPDLPNGEYSSNVRVERIGPDKSLLRLVEP